MALTKVEAFRRPMQWQRGFSGLESLQRKEDSLEGSL